MFSRISQTELWKNIKKNQPQDKESPRDMERYIEPCSSVTYRIQNGYNPNDNCNDFYPIHFHQGKVNKLFRLNNDGEKITLISLDNDFPTTTIQSAIDCSRRCPSIKQFRPLCLPRTQSLSSVEDCEPTYSSISLLSTNEGDDVLEGPSDDADAIISDYEDNLILEKNLNVDNYRQRKAKATNDAVLGKIDSCLVKKTLTTLEAPH